MTQSRRLDESNLNTTKTIHPLLSNYSSTKWGRRETYSTGTSFEILAERRGAYLKGALIPGEH